MKFFFPDSQDLVDPSFDFVRETRSENRLRQRDDVYAHELFDVPPYHGLLVSKAIVDGMGGISGGRYTLAQRHRLLREGVREFFRLERTPARQALETMGDCGAFSYIKEKEPPFTVQSVLEFYSDCGFNYGISVDHVILAYIANADRDSSLVPEDVRDRRELTIELAREFLKLHKAEKCQFTPMGVAQGWSPKSYARSVKQLQSMGYKYIAMGGMVPLKTSEILESLEAANEVRKPDTKFHLLGVTRTEEVKAFAKFGVASFDSTSALRQAFKDDKDNYHTAHRTYVAIRVPQVEGNVRFQKRICAGEVDHDDARRLEQECLEALRRFEIGKSSIDKTVQVLNAYETLYDGKAKHDAAYREVLADKPWKSCPCDICRKIGIHVILFRGAERNRRRGFHNLYMFSRRLERELSAGPKGRSPKTKSVKAGAGASAAAL